MDNINQQTETNETNNQTTTTTAAESTNNTTENNAATAGNATKPADNKQANQTSADTKPAEETLTLDSYNETLGLTATEDVELDKDLLKGFRQFALDNGIKPELANKIAKFQFDAAAKQAQYMKDLNAKWAEENAKTYGDNLKNVETNVGRVLADFDKEGKFKELLTLAGAINAPATLAFLKAVGDVTLEKGSVNPNTQKIQEVNLDLAKTFEANNK